MLYWLVGSQFAVVFLSATVLDGGRLLVVLLALLLAWNLLQIATHLMNASRRWPGHGFLNPVLSRPAVQVFVPIGLLAAAVVISN